MGERLCPELQSVSRILTRAARNNYIHCSRTFVASKWGGKARMGHSAEELHQSLICTSSTAIPGNIMKLLIPTPVDCNDRHRLLRYHLLSQGVHPSTVSEDIRPEPKSRHVPLPSHTHRPLDLRLLLSCPHVRPDLLMSTT